MHRWKINRQTFKRRIFILSRLKTTIVVLAQAGSTHESRLRPHTVSFSLQFFVSVLFSEFSLCWPLREECLPLSWSIPSQRQDTPGQNHTVQFPVSLFAIVCRLDSVCPVKHVPPLKKHPWALLTWTVRVFVRRGSIFKAECTMGSPTYRSMSEACEHLDANINRYS